MQTLPHIRGLLVAAGLVCAMACGRGEAASTDPPLQPTQRKVIVPVRTMAMENYPCARCHTNVTTREPKGEIPRPHSDIKMKHMPNARHCYLCHDKTDRNKLRLISGETVSFNDTPRMCGQCHSTRKRDWDRGIHGKQVGSWRGTSHRYSCADCHDPHAPKRGTVKALPPPPFPRFGVRKQAH